MNTLRRINGGAVNSQSEFEEELSYLNPGNKVKLSYLRDGKGIYRGIYARKPQMTLTDIMKRVVITNATLGAQMEATQYGVKVFNIKESSPLKQNRHSRELYHYCHQPGTGCKILTRS